MAQGSIAISGSEAGGDSAVIVRGVPTTGRISNGAIVEREIPFRLNEMDTVKISLRNPDDDRLADRQEHQRYLRTKPPGCWIPARSS